MKKKIIKGGCLAFAGILFLLFLLFFQGTEKTMLLETEGRNFEKAEVTEILQDNVTESGNIVGTHTVMLKLLSGAHKGELVQANSSSGYLFGAHCEVGMKVVAIVSESGDEMAAGVYTYNREPAVWLMRKGER